MTTKQDKWIIIFLEELNEQRNLTHVVSDEAFRYPKPYDGDLYVVGHDIEGNLHFLLVEMKGHDDLVLRIIEDEGLFIKLSDYYLNEDRLPVSAADEQLRLNIGASFTDNSEREVIRQSFIAKLPMA